MYIINHGKVEVCGVSGNRQLSNYIFTSFARYKVLSV